MMKDPSFQAEMKKFSQSSQFQSALKQTAEEIEVISGILFAESIPEI